jgi:hypothetical protein
MPALPMEYRGACSANVVHVSAYTRTRPARYRDTSPP